VWVCVGGCVCCVGISVRRSGLRVWRGGALELYEVGSFPTALSAKVGENPWDS
jgi:hypothetical protein